MSSPTDQPNAIELATDEPFDGSALELWMPALAERVLASEGVSGRHLSILVTDDTVVLELNSTYRGYDETTDVLSFGLSELAKPAVDDAEFDHGFILPPDTASPLGEVIISFPTAERQAAEHGRSLNMELAHLLIHGILHLLGYDHYEPGEEQLMRSREMVLLADPVWTSAGS